MSKNIKQTSRGVASKASRLLRNSSSRAVRSVAASALVQTKKTRRDK